MESEDKGPKPLFRAFSWHNDDGAPVCWSVDGRDARNLAEEVRDVAAGAKVVMEIVEQDALDETFVDERGEPLPKLLSTQDLAALQRLSILALKQLTEKAEKLAGRWDDQKHPQQPQAGIGRRTRGVH
ncbi:hypothetical protein [Rubrivivax sp. JA1026]|uniref:hypothetical protein n=1 Tax=Rubrivivax sp. JA1026 TaxID=2710888 RepID=UPI0013E9698C|nr:hypothetical protein [Rubrivivax sp. JA1026]